MHQPARWREILAERGLLVTLVASILVISLTYQKPEVFQLDLQSRLHSALIEGFFEPESSPTGPFRWMGERAQIRLSHLWPGQPVDITLYLSAPRPEGLETANPDGTIPVEVRANGRLITTLTPGAGPAEYLLHLDRDVTGHSGNLHLELRAPTFSVPSDLRKLGAILSGLNARPAGTHSAPVLPPVVALLTLTLLACLAYAWLRRLGASRPPALALSLAVVALSGTGVIFARPFVTAAGNRVLFLLTAACLGSDLYSRLKQSGEDIRTRRMAAALFLVAFGIRLILAHTPGDRDNFLAFKMMLENVTRNGIAAAYEIDPVIGAYPPVHHYDLALAGHLYRSFVSPEFDVASRRLNFSMKMPAIVLDMLIALAVMIYAARRRGARSGLVLGAAYALNPGIIYTSSFNGQLGDPLYALFVTVATAALLARRAILTGAATALAVLTKPQASAFLPFLLVAGLRHLSRRERARALMAGATTGLVVLAPYLWARTTGHLIRTVSTTIGHGPRISSEAHNIWWLWGRGNAWEIKDSGLLLGPLSYRATGLLLFFGIASPLIIWRLWHTKERKALALLAAFAGFCFFMLPTEIHENYLFPTIPLLALAAVHDRRAWVLGAILTVTWTANLVVIDQTLVKPLLAAWPALSALLFPLRISTSIINVAVLLVWGWWTLGGEKPASVSRAKMAVQ